MILVIRSIFKNIKSFLNFSGRAARKDFFIFFIFYHICFIVGESINEIYGLTIAIVLSAPLITVSIRRLHDINKSGWNLLIPLVNLYFLTKSGDEGTNRYGKKVSGSK